MSKSAISVQICLKLVFIETGLRDKFFNELDLVSLLSEQRERIQCVCACRQGRLFFFFFKSAIACFSPKGFKVSQGLRGDSDAWRTVENMLLLSPQLCLKARKTQIGLSLEKRKETDFYGAPTVCPNESPKVAY